MYCVLYGLIMMLFEFLEVRMRLQNHHHDMLYDIPGGKLYDRVSDQDGFIPEKPTFVDRSKRRCFSESEHEG